MKIIKNQHHTKETLYFAITKMLESASHLGFKTILGLYMAGEALKMDISDTISTYSWFTISLFFSQILGAVLGDFLFGNKKLIIIGAILQAIGLFCLCIQSSASLYLGLLIIVIGSGLFTPNLISNFGKLYLNKSELLDSGFTFLHLSTNLGLILGFFLIVLLSNKYGFNIGFIFAGVLMLMSFIPIFFLKKNDLKKIENHGVALNKRILTIIMVFITVGLFWSLNDLSTHRIFNLQMKFKELSDLVFPMYTGKFSDTVFFIPINIIAFILWNKFYSNQFFKIILGFFFGVSAFGILLLIPEIPSEQNLPIFIISLLFLGIAEVHILPVMYSVLTKYSNPKYLTLLVSLTFFPTILFSFAFKFFNYGIGANPILGVKIGIIGMTIIGIIIIYCVWKCKKLPTTSVLQNGGLRKK